MGSHCSAIHITESRGMTILHASLWEQRDGHFHQYDMMMKWYLWNYHESFTMQNWMIKYQVYHEIALFTTSCQEINNIHQPNPRKIMHQLRSLPSAFYRLTAFFDRWNSWKSRRNNRRPWMKRRRDRADRRPPAMPDPSSVFFSRWVWCLGGSWEIINQSRYSKSPFINGWLIDYSWLITSCMSN